MCSYHHIICGIPRRHVTVSNPELYGPTSPLELLYIKYSGFLVAITILCITLLYKRLINKKKKCKQTFFVFSLFLSSTEKCQLLATHNICYID